MLVYLNGQWLPREKACISVMDRGFLFGDGVYEVIPAYRGRPFRLQQHLDRLQHSLQAIGMDNPLSDTEWQAIFERLLAQYPDQDQQIYLQITRGVAEQRAHRPPKNIQPTVFVQTSLLPPAPSPEQRPGIRAITLPDIRWQRCDIKAITLLPNIMAQLEAQRQGAQEAILIRQGLAIEGTASNLFIVHKDALITPPKSHCLLPGITRDLVLELAEQAGIDYSERDISLAELQAADEIWITSSTKEIVPIIALDGVERETNNPMYKTMSELFYQYKQQVMYE